MADLTVYKAGFLTSLSSGTGIQYLSEEELNNLTAVWQSYYYEAGKKAKKPNRGKYFLTYLFLRFSGARLSEVLSIDDEKDIDWRNNEVKIRTYKTRRKNAGRIVPLPPAVLQELARFLMEHPGMKGKVFKVDPRNFRRTFFELAVKAGIPEEKAHPHILRHSRAMEMIKAGMPLTIIQNILGHASLNSTAVYLKFSNVEAKMLMREKGLL